MKKDESPPDKPPQDFAKVFWSGNSQAVRLPKSFRFDSDEVELIRVGEGVLITPKTKTKQSTPERNIGWDAFFASYPPITPEDDFMNDRPLNVLLTEEDEKDIF